MTYIGRSSTPLNFPQHNPCSACVTSNSWAATIPSAARREVLPGREAGFTKLQGVDDAREKVGSSAGAEDARDWR